MKRGISQVTSMLGVVAVVLVMFNQSDRLNGQGPNTEPHFLLQIRDMEQADKFYAGGNGQSVTFDIQAARDAGVQNDSIILAQQLAAFTNDVVATANRELKTLRSIPSANVAPEVMVNLRNVDTKAYPSVTEFFSAASANRKRLDGLSDLGRKALTESQHQMIHPKVAKIVGVNEYDAYFECGFFSNPMPSTAKARATFNVSDAVATLRSWGYHDDPLSIRNGAGWTRPQTYKWWVCGWDTFRDNAGPISNNRQLWEQNYSGWTPNGEPNPEFWRSGPWPYSTWPAYVWWWHREH